MNDERRTKKRPRKTVGEWLTLIEEAPIGERIVKVRPVSGGEKWTLVLEGGASFRLGSSSLTELQLGVGEEWTRDRSERARRLEGVGLARHDGLMIVQRRSVTRKGLVDALARKGHARTDADLAAEALERVGLIDDARVAQQAASSIVRRGGVGKRLVEQKLRAKGVSMEEAKKAAADATEGHDPVEDALVLARKKVRSSMGRGDPASVRRKVGAALARRGFDMQTCREATTRAVRELKEEQDDEERYDG